MAGRAGRARNGVVTFLYDVDDTENALRAAELRRAEQEGVENSGASFVTLAIGPPERLIYV